MQRPSSQHLVPLGSAKLPAWPLPALFTNGSFPVNLVRPTPNTFSSTYATANFKDTGTNYYVATTGNDTTGTGAIGNPWLTIQHAHDNVAAGSIINIGAGRFAPAALSKNISLVGTTGTYVGDMLANSAITWGGFAGGKQTATLASGTVSGFVDLTLTKRGVPQVSNVATTAGGIATYQAAGDPGCFRSTPSQVGSSDSRDLTNSADTTTIFWSSAAAAPFTMTGTINVYASGISFICGAGVTVPTGCRFVNESCQFLGAVSQNINNNGTTLSYGSFIRGCRISNNDLLDSGSGASNTVECSVNTTGDQCSNGGSDNCFTQHSGISMRIGCQAYDASRCFADGGLSINGIFGCTIQPGPANPICYHINVGDSETHCLGNTFLPVSGGGGGLSSYGGGAPLCVTRLVFYDQSYVGLSVNAGAGGQPVIDHSSGYVGGDQTFVTFDPSTIGTLWQDTAGTIPVVNVNDPVARIDSVQSHSEYIFLTGTGAAATYQNDGVHAYVLYTGTANAGTWTMTLRNTWMSDTTNIIFGIKSGDTSGILYYTKSPNTLGDYRNAGPLTGASTSPGGQKPGSPLYHVDGGSASYTTGTALKAAAFTNTPHVITIKNAVLSWTGWLQEGPTPGQPVSFLATFDGSFYGAEFSNLTTDANLRAREQRMANKCGATLV